jgi:hypothetical protein
MCEAMNELRTDVSGEVEKKGWFAKNGQLVTATCSVLIAVLSLVVAIVSLRLNAAQQEADLTYKELLITPNLFLIADDAELSASLINSGLGPARVKSVVVSFGEHCYDSGGEQPEQWSQTANKVRSELAAFIFAEILPDVRLSNPFATGEAAMVSLGELIPAQGGTVRLLGLRSQQASASMPTSDEVRSRVRKTFAKQIQQVKLNIKYCSMTDRFCTNLVGENIICSR